MAEDIKQRLRVIVSVALALVPRGVRRQYSEKLTLTADVAKDKIAEAITESVSQSFDMTERPVDHGPPLGSRQTVQSKGVEGE